MIQSFNTLPAIHPVINGLPHLSNPAGSHLFYIHIQFPHTGIYSRVRKLAEREGFEPPVPKGTTVFKTAALNHSATSPDARSIADLALSGHPRQTELKRYILIDCRGLNQRLS